MSKLKNLVNKLSGGYLFPSNENQQNASTLQLTTNEDAPTAVAVFSQKLQTEPLESALMTTSRSLPLSLSDKFEPEDDDGFFPLITDLVKSYSDIWKQWEKKYCDNLRTEIPMIKEEMDGYSTDNEKSKYFETIGEYGNGLKESLKNAFRTRETNKAAFRELRTKRDNLKYDIQILSIGLTGDKDLGIPAKSSPWMILGLVAMVLVIGAIENILGFGTFKYDSDTAMALALSTTVVGFFATVSFIGGNGASKLMANWDAHRRFKRNYPEERNYKLDRHGVPAKPFLPSIPAWAQFIIGTGLFVLATLILLFNRIEIISRMSSEDSSMYLTGAVALIFLNVLLYCYEMLYGSKYDKTDIEKYWSLQDELEQAKADMQNIRPEAHLDRINAAITNYENGISYLRQAVEDKISWLQRLAQSFIGLEESYVGAWKTTTDSFTKAGTNLGKKVQIKYNLPDDDIDKAFNDPDNPFIGYLERKIERTLDDPELLDKVKNWKVEMPDLGTGTQRITDYAATIKEAEERALTELRSESTKTKRWGGIKS